MLDTERIPIGKLKQAFDLNGQDVETVISTLWPNRVFPYALWEMAYRPRWKDAASHNTIFYKAKALSSFPEFDPSEHELPLLFIYSDRMIKFFQELSAIIFATDLMYGFNRIMELVYEKNNNVFQDDIKYVFDGLSRIESELNFGIHRPFTWAANMTAERFHEVFEEKAIFVASYSFAFLAEIFLDAIVVDKIAAIRYLIDGGYPLRQEVKGISKAIVDRIWASIDTTATASPSQQSTADPVLPALIMEESSSPEVSSVLIPTPHSTGSKKDNERIKATRQACEDVTSELYQEKQILDNDKNNWKPYLLCATGKSTKAVFMKAVQTRLNSRFHQETIEQAWREVPKNFKHKGRVPEQ